MVVAGMLVCEAGAAGSIPDTPLDGNDFGRFDHPVGVDSIGDVTLAERHLSTGSRELVGSEREPLLVCVGALDHPT